MQNYEYGNETGSQTIKDQSAQVPALVPVPSKMTTEHITTPSVVVSKPTLNTNKSAESTSMHSANGVVYGSVGSYHASGISYIPPVVDNKTIKTEGETNALSYPYVYEHKLPSGAVIYTDTYEHSQNNPSAVNNNTSMYTKQPYYLDKNVNWKNGIPVQTEQLDGSHIQPESIHLNNTCNMNYTMQEPHTTYIPPMHKTVPPRVINQTPTSSNVLRDTSFYGQQGRNINDGKYNNGTFVQPQVESYGTPSKTPYVPPTHTRYIPCKVNPVSETNPTIRNFHEHKIEPAATTINYTPAASSIVPNYAVTSPRHIQYDPMRPMRHMSQMSQMLPMSPSNSPLSYVVVKENDNRCLLKKGIDYAMDGCKMNNGYRYVPKHEYFIRGTRGTPLGPVFPYVSFEDSKKFDVFKKLTLKVGSCLDDLVNVFIESLSSSIEILHKNNEVKLHDLHPFYNPDPVYTRPERPTLKTGNNIIDNINTALDGSTLEKHKNIPKPNMRIPVPKTEKTGHVVVDGLNNILDSLLNEPLSYHKYDYFSDKADIRNYTSKTDAVAFK